MTHYDFDTVPDRSGTHSLKWDFEQARFPDHKIIAAMGVADMDFRIAPEITAALQKCVDHQVWGYGVVPKSFKETVVAWLASHYRECIAPEQIFVTPGLIPSMRSAIQTFCRPGGSVIVQSPVYHGFYMITERAGCRVIENQLIKKSDGSYVMDLDALAAQIEPDTGVILLCNPHNPTGNCWSKEDLLAVGRLCLERGVVVLADEVHADFIHSGSTFTPFSTLDDAEVVNNAVVFKAASKSFNLAGLHVSYMYSNNQEYLDRMVKGGLSRLVNTAGVVATEAAYTHGEDWLRQVMTYIEGTLHLVVDFVGGSLPGVDVRMPDATCFAWLDVSELTDRLCARDAAAKAGPGVEPEHILQKWLVEQAGVHLTDGPDFGRGGAGHMRMNVATSRAIVQEGLGRMAAAIERVSR